MGVQRGQWSSKLGFIFASAGSAIGLGNIWRFPYTVGENGGAAFVLLYIFFVFIIGLPYLYAEFALGRHANQNAIDAIKTISPKSKWKWIGALGILTGTGILSFYGVIAGWTVGYVYKSSVSDFGGFTEFIADPLAVISLFAGFMVLTALIVSKGVSGGIEKASKILMPVLLIILVALTIYANTLEGAVKGLDFYLNPDFSKLTGKAIMSALGQAFFSLSLGMGLMVTYGSYLSKDEDIMQSGFLIGSFDTLIAILSGLIIFPALFAMGENPEAGPILVFVVFPKLFSNMPAGEIVGAAFFILLSIAALTSTISLLEVPVSYFVDSTKMSREKLVWIVAFVTFLIGIPAALSQGAVESLSNFGFISEHFTSPDFLSQMSFIFGDFSLALGALLLSIFIGWIWGADKAAKELESGSKYFKKISIIWQISVKYVIPLVVFIILLNLFKVFE